MLIKLKNRLKYFLYDFKTKVYLDDSDNLKGLITITEIDKYNDKITYTYEALKTSKIQKYTISAKHWFELNYEAVSLFEKTYIDSFHFLQSLYKQPQEVIISSGREYILDDIKRVSACSRTFILKELSINDSNIDRAVCKTRDNLCFSVYTHYIKSYKAL